MIKLTPWKQSDSSRCGPAVIKMVLAYYGIEASEDEIAKRCNHTFELGCTNMDMKHAFESYGLNVSIYHYSTMEALEHCVKHKIPVIVDWLTPGVSRNKWEMPNGHSSIVVGMDKEYIHILDPEDAEVRKIYKQDFLRVWFDWYQEPTITPDNLIVRLAMIAKPPRVGPRFKFRKDND